jgi:hypothetical protein
MASVSITVPDNTVTASGTAGLPVIIVVPSNTVTLTGAATVTPYVYVVDSLNNRVEAFDYDGNYKFYWGSYGTGDGEFDHPYGICNDGDYVWVTDSFNNRIQKFTLFGVFVESIGGVSGDGEGEFDLPMGIACDDDWLYVIDQNNHRFQMFDKLYGEFKLELGSYGGGTLEFRFPTNIAVDDYYIYVDDTGNGRTVVIPKIDFGNNVSVTAEAHTVSATGIISDVARCELESPAHTAYVYAYITIRSNVDVTSPPNYTSSSTIQINTANVNVESPMHSSITVSGTVVHVESPMHTIVSTGTLTNIAAVDVKSAHSECESESSMMLYASVDVISPMSRPESSGVFTNIALVNVTSPFHTIYLTPPFSNVGNISVESTGHSSSVYGILYLSGTVEVESQMHELNIVARIEALADYLTLVLNTSTSAITEYDNYDFNSFTEFNGNYLGCSSEGIELLEGDDDNGDDINSVVTYPTLDNNLALLRQLREAWFTGTNTGELTIDVKERESGTVYTYKTNKINSDTHDDRIKFGKGFKNRFFDFTVKNIDGCDFSINSIRIFSEKTIPKAR